MTQLRKSIFARTKADKLSANITGMSQWEGVKRAIGRVDTRFPDGLELRGTCFLVTGDLVLTCMHVVANLGSDDWRNDLGEIYITFENHVSKASLTSDYYSVEEDWALLKLENPSPDSPLTLSDDVSMGAEWQSFGFPDTSPDSGSVCAGKVRDPIARYKNTWAIQLFSNEAAAGNGAPLFGYSGGPCIINNKVVGVMRSAIKDAYGDSVAGTIFATPISIICERNNPIPEIVAQELPNNLQDYLSTVDGYCNSTPYLSLHEMQPDPSLKDVYINLRAREHNKENRKAKKEEVIGSVASGFKSTSVLTPKDVLDDSQDSHILIIGEPGAGKSTLLRHIASHAWYSPHKIGLPVSHIPAIMTLSNLAEEKGSPLERFTKTLKVQLPVEINNLSLEQFHEETGKPILVLLDSLDEVPRQKKRKLVDWLKVVVSQSKHYKIIITTRSTGYMPGEFGAGVLKEYELLPFSIEQTIEFADRWFGELKDVFLKELELLCPLDLRGTPLLLTIAAKVFSSKGSLPARRSDLYEMFVDTWHKEAMSNDLEKEIPNGRVIKVARQIISKIAFFITENKGEIDHVDLLNFVKNSFVEIFDYHPDEGEADAEIFISVMVRRSGVFIKSENQYNFIHPTFREYLAAEALVKREENKPEDIFREIEKYDFSDTWHEVFLFSIGILAKNKVDLSKQLDKLLPNYLKECMGVEVEDEWDAFEIITPCYEAVYLVVLALSEGALVNDSFKKKVTDAVLTCIDWMEETGVLIDFLESPSGPMYALERLSSFKYTENRIREFLENRADFTDQLSFSALETLINIGLNGDDLHKIISWAMGIEPFFIGEENNSSYNFNARLDISDIFMKCGYVETGRYLRSYLLLSVNDHQLSDWIDGVIDSFSKKTTSKNIRDAMRDGEKIHKKTSVLLSILEAHNIDSIIVKFIHNREFVVSDKLRIIISKLNIRERKIIKEELTSVAIDKNNDEMHRVDSAIVIAELFGDCTPLECLLEYCDEVKNGYSYEYGMKNLKEMPNYNAK